jgi:outer membrane scaffolding protein for murein synthesis (MipA/OmpV family)
VDLPEWGRVGILAVPSLVLDHDAFPAAGWRFSLALGGYWADDDYYNYYYAVDQQHETVSRPRYEPPGGYGGTWIRTTFSRRFEDIWVGGFLVCQDLSGAVFADSPLVETERSVTAGVGIAWVISRSEKAVRID